MAQGSRFEGIDVARALAMFGMVIVNFKIAMSATTDNNWLNALTALFEGRASALFVVLAGLGIGLMSARATRQPQQRPAVRLTLLKRGLLLFVAGLLYTPVWPADILHFYGIYFVIAALLFHRSSRVVGATATGLVLLFPLLMLLFDYDKGWNWQDFTYQGFWTLDGMSRHLLFNGFHPVIPWSAFLLLGLLLSRLDLSDVRIRRRLFAVSLCLVLTIEGGLWGLRQLLQGELSLVEIDLLLRASILPPLPQYMFSAAASAVCVLMLCLAIPSRMLQGGFGRALVYTGQLSLTHYVAHVLLGMGMLEGLGLLKQQSLELSLSAALLFCCLALLFSALWRRYFTLGPLEWAFRKLT